LRGCTAAFSPTTDAAGGAEHRRELLAGLNGRVLELGAGNGLNFPHYPATVTEVVAVEPEDYLRERARHAAAGAPVTVTAVDAVADQLPFDDASFDAAVASLVLCSVPDQATALAELHRVVRAGGELRFYEHVRPNNPRTAAVWQRLDDWNIWPRLAGGCHAARDTEAAIRAAGFTVEQCRRFPFKGGPITAPHILGLARRPWTTRLLAGLRSSGEVGSDDVYCPCSPVFKHRSGGDFAERVTVLRKPAT
jgi:SAM-dependent methyltransferase